MNKKSFLQNNHHNKLYKKKASPKKATITKHRDTGDLLPTSNLLPEPVACALHGFALTAVDVGQQQLLDLA